MANEKDIRDFCKAVNVDLENNQSTITFTFEQIIQLREYLKEPYDEMLKVSDGIDYDDLKDNHKMIFDLYELVDDSYIRLSQQFGVDVPMDIY